MRQGAGSGLIPAHAGKTRTLAANCGETAAHPRSRGENHFESLASLFVSGSSPLTRGKRVGSLREVDEFRLIPAHAGKTTRRHHHRNHPEAHPRSRGENLRAVNTSSSAAGSSPLTRGKLS